MVIAYSAYRSREEIGRGKVDTKQDTYQVHTTYQPASHAYKDTR